MSWSEKLMASLDARASVIRTSRGDVQFARDGEGPPVLVSHGGPGGFDQGLAWCRHLRDGGCEVIAPSRPGYLRTPLESGPSIEGQADLFAAMLDALQIPKVAILGFSSGGPPAVHFVARYPDRATALILDTAILLPFEPPISALQRATLESTFAVWLTYQAVKRVPRLMTRFMIDGVTEGLTRQQRRAATDWITSDAARLRGMQEQFGSTSPPRYRKPGWANDQANERDLAPLPFAAVHAPTLIAHGMNDAIVGIEHAEAAANTIAGAELLLVEEGHHILSTSRNYGPAARRQIELVHG